jgi:hypothetical protein
MFADPQYFPYMTFGDTKPGSGSIGAAHQGSADMAVDPEIRRPRNLTWLSNAAGALTTLCRGAILTIEPRGGNQWPWTVAVDGHKVSEGVAPTLEDAQIDAVDVAVEIASRRRPDHDARRGHGPNRISIPRCYATTKTDNQEASRDSST